MRSDNATVGPELVQPKRAIDRDPMNGFAREFARVDLSWLTAMKFENEALEM